MSAGDVDAEVLAEAESYFAAGWDRPDELPPFQKIELRLAFYAGMLSSFTLLLKPGRTADSIGDLADAIQARALKLNEERARLRAEAPPRPGDCREPVCETGECLPNKGKAG